jgi:hypothetical protein
MQVSIIVLPRSWQSTCTPPLTASSSPVPIETLREPPKERGDVDVVASTYARLSNLTGAYMQSFDWLVGFAI